MPARTWGFQLIPNLVTFQLTPHRKPAIFIGSSIDDWRAFPLEVQDDMGHALDDLQAGGFPVGAKRLAKLGAGIVELIERFDGDTYRGVCVVAFPEAVYVLHAFKKKSKSGIAMPPKDVERIQKRLKTAEEAHAAYERDQDRGR